VGDNGVVKLDPSGSLKWTRKFVGSYLDIGRSILQTFDVDIWEWALLRVVMVILQVTIQLESIQGQILKQEKIQSFKNLIHH
jgi:hypothetical protein